MIERARKRLSKRAKKGFRGWPLATVALYGPDDSTATKLTVGIVPAEDAEATDLRRWLSKEQTDIRDDIRVTEEVLAFITEAGAKSVVMTERIIGCPHEEGIDYEGATCPVCPFWAGRDRWTGKRLHEPELFNPNDPRCPFRDRGSALTLIIAQIASTSSAVSAIGLPSLRGRGR